MDTTDTTAFSTTTAAPSTAAATPSTAAEGGKSVFGDLLSQLGNHHVLSFGPLGQVELPYLFWDKDGFHAFSGQTALLKTGTYTIDESKETSPISEKGNVLRKDGGSIGLDLSITSNLCFLGLAAIIVFVLVRIAAQGSKRSLIPKGLTNLVEVLVVFVRDEIVYPNIEQPWGEKFMPFFLTVFFFVTVANLLGLLPQAHTATSSIPVTAGLALCTFVLTQVTGIRSMGLKHYLLHFTGGLHEMDINAGLKVVLLIIMVPIEIMGLFTKPFALAVRLFANMTAGHIVIFSLIGLTFFFHSYAVGALVSTPFALFIFILEIFVALLQAYIFTMLSAVFVGFMAHTPHEAHEEDHDLHHVNGDHLVATSHSV